MLQTILLVVMIVISIALTGVVLIQRSEGGALGMGGGPSGFMSARGAGNLLTKTTWVLGTLFASCALALTVVGNMERGSTSMIDAEAVGSIALHQPQHTAPAETPPPGTPAEPSGPSLGDLEDSLATVPAAPAEPAPAPAQ